MSKLIGASAFVLATCVAAPVDALAQSLAALAEQGSSQNGAAQKTYTNADLEAITAPPDRTSGPAAPDAPVAPLSVQATPPTPRPVEEHAGAGRVNVVMKVDKNSSAENEHYWRRVTKSVKDRIATAEAELVMIAARLDAAGGTDREKLTTLQTKRQRDLEFLHAEYAGHVKRAQALGVPAEWLR